jgi:hypothetical protein
LHCWGTEDGNQEVRIVCVAKRGKRLPTEISSLFFCLDETVCVCVCASERRWAKERTKIIIQNFHYSFTDLTQFERETALG